MRNPYKALVELLQGPALQLGQVTAVAGSTVIVELPDGATIQARGEGSIGQRVFVRGGVIEGQAPDLPVSIISV